MPRLIQFFASFQIGGIERSMLNLSRQFTQAGLEVVLVVLRGDGPLRELVPEGVRVIELGEKRNTFFALPKFMRALRQVKPDAVLSAHPNLNFVAILARSLSRQRFRLVISERNSLTMSSRSGARLSLRLRPLLERLLYPRADSIVAVSRALAEDMASSTGLPAETIQAIYNPVYSEQLVERTREAVPEAFFPPGVPVILGVGRLVNAKDFQTLIQAFATVRTRREVRLLILGEGPLRAKLEALIQSMGIAEDTCLPGFVTNPYAFMARASLFVLSSRYEGFPNVLAESLACGTPVVATDCPTGPAEILEGGRFGRLVPVGDVKALAEAVEATLDSPPDRETVLRRGADFSAASSARQYLNLLFPGRNFDTRSPL